MEDNNRPAADLDGDGKISERERNFFLEKIENNQKMAWIAFTSIILSGLYLLTMASETRLGSFDNVLDWFFIALVSVIGFHFGVQGFAGKK